ncbi:MAG: rhodanese-like domain-containing protein [Desulfobacteraceae bacterium]|nr:rhodanese-like domain-containing protein [Desulfobacteraceae bacterium]
MRKKSSLLILFFSLAVLLFPLAPWSQAAEKGENIGSDISIEELRQVLAEGKIPVFDVRPEKEFAISHIPGSVHIFESEIDRMAQACTDKSSGPVIYCNGPYCHKTLRVAEQLAEKGFTNPRKFRLGLPVWRAFGNTAETNLTGLKQVYGADKTAVFVDARSKEEYAAGTLPGAVNINPGQCEAANKDGRLPYTDHGTRLIVFGRDVAQARQMAEEIAHRAYWNSSYLSVAYDEMKKAGLW